MEKQSRDMKELLRFAMEQTDSTKDVTVEPEKMAWLQDMITSTTVDVTKILKSDISALSAMLSVPEPDLDTIRSLLEELLSITEDIDVANDFFKVGGKDLLLQLLLTELTCLKEGVYNLLANLTQNNPKAQQICLDCGILDHLLSSMKKEENLDRLKKILLSISCLVRHHSPGAAAFYDADGLSIVLDQLHWLTTNCNDTRLDPVVVKGSFLIFSLIQELPLRYLSSPQIQQVPDKLITLAIHSPTGAQEHLLASIIMLLSGRRTVDNALDTENPSEENKLVPLPVSPTSANDLQQWLTKRCCELDGENDPAYTELHRYITILKHLMTMRNA